MADELCSMLCQQQIFDVNENLELLLEDIDELRSVITYDTQLVNESAMCVRARMYLHHVHQPYHLGALLRRSIASDLDDFVFMFFCWCVAIRDLLDHTV